MKESSALLVNRPGQQSILGTDSKKWLFALYYLQVECEGVSDGRFAEEVAVDIVWFVGRTWVVANLHPCAIHGSLDRVILALLHLGLEVGEGI